MYGHIAAETIFRDVPIAFDRRTDCSNARTDGIGRLFHWFTDPAGKI